MAGAAVSKDTGDDKSTGNPFGRNTSRKSGRKSRKSSRS